MEEAAAKFREAGAPACLGLGPQGSGTRVGSPGRCARQARPWPSPPPLTCPRAPPAGAHPTDIRNALKGHPLADQMEDLIGPEPEPEAAVVAAEAGGSGGAEKKEAKGLPSMERKKKAAA